MDVPTIAYFLNNFCGDDFFLTRFLNNRSYFNTVYIVRTAFSTCRKYAAAQRLRPCFAGPILARNERRRWVLG